MPSLERVETLAFSALLGGLVWLAAGTAAAQPATTIIIFDGSGSMMGKLEGAKQSKLVQAREAVRSALSKVNPETRIGLASFGHRRKGCLDVELMVPPQKVDAEKIMASLTQLDPRGRGPITHALREMAKTLGTFSGQRSLILIHDGPDNCQQDPCTAVADIRSSAPGAAVHVIGLGLEAGDLAKMACLTNATGGRLFDARNEEQIAAALEQALRVSAADPGRLAAPGPVPDSRTQPPAPEPQIPVGASGLVLRALLAPKSDAIGWPLKWTVAPEGRPSEPIYEGRAASLFVPAAPGRYVVEAQDGLASAKQVVDVEAGEAKRAELVLNAGTLRMRTLAQKSGAPIAETVITVVETTPAGKGTVAPSLARTGIFRGPEAIATLPAGHYLIQVEHGLARSERAVVVPAGSQGRIDLPVNSARLQVMAVPREDGGQLEAPIYSVSEDDPDAPKGRREVARSAARQAEFVLSPGTYYVAARQGGAETRERIAVAAGDIVKRTLALSVARLALSIKPPVTGSAGAEPVSYRIERLDAATEPIVTTQTSPTLQLPPGRYRVESRYGTINARAVREVELKSGQSQQISFEHQAGSLRLRLTTTPGGLPLGDVFWVVQDESGRRLWTGGQVEPLVVLQAGRYAISAETREKRYNMSVEVRAGDSKLVELTAE
jgi:Ca-activated chloride channel family protein